MYFLETFGILWMFPIGFSPFLRGFMYEVFNMTIKDVTLSELNLNYGYF